MDDFKIPEIAKGRFMPTAVANQLIQEELEEEARKKQFKHDWKIAIFSCVGGGIMGLLTSIIFWLLSAR